MPTSTTPSSPVAKKGEEKLDTAMVQHATSSVADTLYTPLEIRLRSTPMDILWWMLVGIMGVFLRACCLKRNHVEDSQIQQCIRYPGRNYVTYTKKKILISVWRGDRSRRPPQLTDTRTQSHEYISIPCRLAVRDIEVSGSAGGGVGWGMWMQEARMVDALTERGNGVQLGQTMKQRKGVASSPMRRYTSIAVLPVGPMARIRPFLLYPTILQPASTARILRPTFLRYSYAPSMQGLGPLMQPISACIRRGVDEPNVTQTPGLRRNKKNSVMSAEPSLLKALQSFLETRLGLACERAGAGWSRRQRSGGIIWGSKAEPGRRVGAKDDIERKAA
ncbi:hypothetical protein B0H13DRAFT_1913096 [Mycena leptocephala]|nr:hypothetical protein B0H13DRAFT_1913096 [Mycena leptocephala]